MSFISAVNRRMESMSGPWLIFIGALFWSTAGAVIKSFETEPLLLAGIRSLIAGIVLSFAIRPRQMRFDRWLLLLILFYTGIVICVVYSFRLTSATLVIAMQYTATIWLFFLHWLLTKKLEKSRIPVMLLIVAAIVIVMLEPNDSTTIKGNLLALNMGWLFAGVSFCMKRVYCKSPLGLVSVMNLGSGIIILPLAVILPGVNLYVAAADLLYIMYLAIFQLSAGYFFYIHGIKKVTPQKATLLAVWELVLTPVWAFLIIKEIPSLFITVSVIILIFALFWDNRTDNRLGGYQPGKA